MPINDPWLQQVQEEILEPDLPIIDPHHHLWFMGPQFPYRTFDYMMPELDRDLDSGHRIIATVFIEARANARPDGPEHLRTVGETEWVNGLADDHAHDRSGRRENKTEVAAAIVGRADLMLDPGQLDELLDAHQAAVPERFRGVRASCTYSDDPAVIGKHILNPPHRLLDPAFRRGFARLAPRRLSFEAWLYHPQLPELIDLARAFPDSTIIVNHLGGPLGAGRYAGQREAMFSEWKRSIIELARSPNVYMKLGGAAMHMFGFNWEHQALPPSSDRIVADAGRYFHAAIEAFTPARCMFESNFPVDRDGCSYAVLWNAFKKVSAGYSATERADLFRITAARAYRLPQFLNQ